MKNLVELSGILGSTVRKPVERPHRTLGRRRSDLLSRGQIRQLVPDAAAIPTKVGIAPGNGLDANAAC